MAMGFLSIATEEVVDSSLALLGLLFVELVPVPALADAVIKEANCKYFQHFVTLS